MENKISEIIDLLTSEKSSRTIKQLSDYAHISDEFASKLIDSYQKILNYKAKISKYGMANDDLIKADQEIILSLLSNDEEKQPQKLVG